LSERLSKSSVSCVDFPADSSLPKASGAPGILCDPFCTRQCATRMAFGVT
jgi:hypothetical protein